MNADSALLPFPIQLQRAKRARPEAHAKTRKMGCPAFGWKVETRQESTRLRYHSDHMNPNRSGFKRYALPLLGTVVTIGAGVAFYLYWHHPDQLQAVGVIASFAIAADLAAVTWQYAYATEQMVELLREQWKSQQALHIRFGMKVQDQRARVWIRNLGTSHFMVAKAVVRNDSATETIDLHMVVAPDSKVGFFFPDSLWKSFTFFGDVNVKLYYESATQPMTSLSKAYTLSVGSEPKKVYKIRKGIRRWYAHCPKCLSAGGTFNRGIDTNGLTNFEEAIARQKEAESEFEATCPNHQSQWES